MRRALLRDSAARQRMHRARQRFKKRLCEVGIFVDD
jgi:hypothetical protein